MTHIEAPEGRPEAPEKHPPVKKPPQGSLARAGQNVTEARLKKKMTQADCAKQAVWGVNELQRFEQGFGNPSIGMVIRLAAVVEFGPWYELFTR